MHELLLLFIAPFIGLLIGLLPAIGSFITMISFYPILVNVDPNIAIYFYAMMFTASQFSGSLAAIWFGVLGEPTAIPIIREREYIVKNGLHLISLRNTSLASVIATLFSTIGLIIFVQLSTEAKWLLRTEVKLFLACLVLTFCLFWPYNKWYENFALIIFGLFLGTIGYDQFTKIDFLTFDNPYLYGGLPLLSVLMGLYAIPMIFKSFKQINVPVHSADSSRSVFLPFSLTAALRGSLIGFLIGLVPMIGAIICSNIAHFIEKYISKTDTNENILRRITSAEAANNSATISLLIPLLVLGLPIQPSEIILYDIITTNNWHVGLVTANTLIYLFGFLIIAAAVCHVICWTFVQRFTDWIHKYYAFLVYAVIISISLNILYIGYQSHQIFYHFLIFVLMIIIGLILTRKYDILPILMAFMMQTHVMLSVNILLTKYI